MSFFAYMITIAKDLTAGTDVTKLTANTPAMPMACLQATHKSSGFFVFKSLENLSVHKFSSLREAS
jgi:hypothetical protein